MGKAKEELIEKFDELRIYLKNNDVKNVKKECECDTNRTNTLYQNKIKNMVIAN